MDSVQGNGNYEQFWIFVFELFKCKLNWNCQFLHSRLHAIINRYKLYNRCKSSYWIEQLFSLDWATIFIKYWHVSYGFRWKFNLDTHIERIIKQFFVINKIISGFKLNRWWKKNYLELLELINSAVTSGWIVDLFCNFITSDGWNDSERAFDGWSRTVHVRDEWKHKQTSHYHVPSDNVLNPIMRLSFHGSIEYHAIKYPVVYTNHRCQRKKKHKQNKQVHTFEAVRVRNIVSHIEVKSQTSIKQSSV